MKVTSVTMNECGVESAKFSSVPDTEDNTCVKATSSKSVEMQVDNKVVHGAFVTGEKYYVVFEPIK